MQRTDSFSIFKDLIIISSFFYSARDIYKIFVKYFTEFLSSFRTLLHTADLFKTFIRTPLVSAHVTHDGDV